MAQMAGLTRATCAPGLRSPLSKLRRDRAHPCHICAGAGLAAAHICNGTWLTIGRLTATAAFHTSATAACASQPRRDSMVQRYVQ